MPKELSKQQNKALKASKKSFREELDRVAPKKLKPIVVTITKTRHKKQPYQCSILRPGKRIATDNDKRYSSPSNAVRSAMNAVGAVYHGKIVGELWPDSFYAGPGWYVWTIKDSYRHVQVIRAYQKKKK